MKSLCLLMLLTLFSFAESINEQIQSLEGATVEERVAMMNHIKEQLIEMNQNERMQTIDKLREKSESSELKEEASREEHQEIPGGNKSEIKGEREEAYAHHEEGSQEEEHQSHEERSNFDFPMEETESSRGEIERIREEHEHRYENQESLREHPVNPREDQSDLRG